MTAAQAASGMTIGTASNAMEGDANGLVRNPAAAVATEPRDPALALAGEAGLPTTNAAGAPCIIGE